MSADPASDHDVLADEAAELDGYFSDTPLDPKPFANYPPLRDTFETAVILANLPKVKQEKVEKLTKVMTKLVSRIGTLGVCEETGFSGVSLPFNSSAGITYGFAFVEFASPEEARQAVEVLQDYKFDKNHSLKVYPYTRAVELAEVEEEEFTEPEPAPFVERANTTSWLEDPSQRDEYVIRHGKETVVNWSDGKTDPVVDYAGEREKKAGVAWCEYYVHWSPQGSFLATLVPNKGVILWGGSKYEKLGRFPAPGVEFVLFSPQENFLLTNNNRRDDPNAIKVFSIQSGKLLRAFPLFPAKFLPENASKEETAHIPPPPFQWSHDDKYLARMGRDLISIYETPSMKLLDKRSLIADGIHEFQFSPKADILAYWAPEHGNAPAHVDLIELPTRKKLRQKNLFNVTKCSMVWHEQGTYLGVKVTRHTKSKKTLYNNLELFRLSEPGIPVDMLEVKDAVMAFAWEPRGSRFATIHAENPTAAKVNVSFYDMMKKEKPDNKKKKNAAQAKGQLSKSVGGSKETVLVPELHKVRTLEGKQCNCIFWSPAGTQIVLASLGDSASGTLEFYDADSESLVVKEHYRANQVIWDPSGRTVATCVSQPIGGGHFKFAMDNGYYLWSFQGRQLHQESFETFHQLQWRPRAELLPGDKRAQVVRDLKKYERRFDQEDKDRTRAEYLEKTKEKRALRTAFRERLARLKDFRRGQRGARIDLLGGYDSEDDGNYVSTEAVVETTLSTKEETVY
uniref:Eukaryotic translation initiation factor 3 subunit B n=1 Tax=Odontella aurita TaxID=265563 RepID=A0A7S4MRK3_9STRA|mmetsp:Transcript_29678/g.88037  ORF Transcript_29678/g.88037 Transcript_29678/m.88037 type:complete len:738 (+) Transcript_29678:149-2362(+)